MDYSRLRNGTDVRGIAVAGVAGEEVDFTKEAARDIAHAFCVWLKNKLGKKTVTVAAGYDSRISAPVLLSGVEEGVTDGGDDVIVTGLSSTPSMFMLLQEKDFFDVVPDGSVMITASHLPYNRNGLKFFTKESGLEAEDVKEILEIAGKEYVPVDAQSRGVIEKKSYMDKYAAAWRGYDRLAIFNARRVF